MPIGDLFLKLGRGETLSAGELDQLRVRMNFIESTASRAGEVMASQGAGLKPDVFQNSGMFSLLPHEAAALHQLAATGQSIDNNTWTTVTADAASGATFSEGLGIDTTNSRITVSGIPRETIVDIVAWAIFDTNTTGLRGIKWVADDGSSHTIVQSASELSGAGGNAAVQLVHKRKVSSASTYYYTQVYQNSGAALILGGAYFAMSRIR